MKKAGVWSTERPVDHTLIKTLEIEFLNFEGEKKTRQIVVLDEVAEDVLSILKKSWSGISHRENFTRQEVPGEDIRSMEANGSWLVLPACQFYV